MMCLLGSQSDDVDRGAHAKVGVLTEVPLFCFSRLYRSDGNTSDARYYIEIT